jgi:hypothetical protein
LIANLSLSFDSPFLIGDLSAAYRLEPITSLSVALGPRQAQWRAVNSPCLHRVRYLCLDVPPVYHPITAATFDALCASENWSGLTELSFIRRSVDHVSIPREYAGALAGAPLLTQIESIFIYGDCDTVRQLVTSPLSRNVRSFYATASRLPPEAGAVLATSTSRGRLEVLDLRANDLGDVGIGELCRHPWPSLHSLDLSGNTLSDNGVQRLLPLVPQLRALGLGGDITDGGALAVAEAVDASKLQSLWLGVVGLSPTTVKRLRTRFGERFSCPDLVEDERRRQHAP